MTTTILTGDCRDLLPTLPAGSVQCCVTSPPYFGLRNYNVEGQIGLEPTVEAYVAEMVAVFAEVRRVLADDGVMFLNLGDSYARAGGTDRKMSATALTGNTRRSMDIAGDRTSTPPVGLKDKDLIGIPWRVAFALQADGWYLRQDIIWAKPNPMPESVTDRCTKSHEYLFLLTKSARYYFDAKAIAEASIKGDAGAGHRNYRPGTEGNQRKHEGQSEMSDRAIRNKRSVWTIATQPFKEAHFATFPEALVEPCILAGSREGDTVLDPFAGSGTTLGVANRLGRHGIGIELNPEYVGMIERRTAQLALEVAS